MKVKLNIDQNEVSWLRQAGRGLVDDNSVMLVEPVCPSCTEETPHGERGDMIVEGRTL